MRARRRDRHLLVAAVLVIVGLWLLAAQRVEAAPRTSPTCWWEGDTVRAAGLPDRMFGITYDVPHGVWLRSADGTFSRSGLLPGALTIYTRGGGGALYKWGAQFNDYHPICVAVP